MTAKFNFLLPVILILLPAASLKGQISGDAPKKLPDDLPTETILFLKFDSVQIGDLRPETMTKDHYAKWAGYNKNVPKYNAQLYAYASKYPFSYKIISMSEKDNYRAKGAKYLLWMNGFDELIVDGSGATGKMCVLDHAEGDGAYCSSSVPNTQLGIMDLSSDRTYLINKRVSVSLTYRYDKLIPQLLKMIESQFGMTSHK